MYYFLTGTVVENFPGTLAISHSESTIATQQVILYHWYAVTAYVVCRFYANTIITCLVDRMQIQPVQYIIVKARAVRVIEYEGRGREAQYSTRRSRVLENLAALRCSWLLTNLKVLSQ